MIFLRVLQYLCCIPVKFVVMVAGVILAPFLALLADSDGYLPRWASWYQTPDNPVDGDPGHIQRWWKWPQYIRRVAWLVRNNASGFDVSVLRARTNGPVKVIGNPKVSNRPLVEGLVIRTVPEGYFQCYYVKAYTKRLCVRVNLGWRLWNEPGHPKFGAFDCSPGLAMKWEA